MSNLSCSWCGYTTPSSATLYAHRVLDHRLGSTDGPFRCNEELEYQGSRVTCPGTFSRKDKLQEHRKKVHGYTSQGKPSRLFKGIEAWKHALQFIDGETLNHNRKLSSRQINPVRDCDGNIKAVNIILGCTGKACGKRVRLNASVDPSVGTSGVSCWKYVDKIAPRTSIDLVRFNCIRVYSTLGQNHEERNDEQSYLPMTAQLRIDEIVKVSCRLLFVLCIVPALYLVSRVMNVYLLCK
eukprot:gb/GECG01000827.1/.p1 GENE.gb/GECG01000827.1/~~gb/GECG01000827.1/.p1  ORF type:complete len:239 (+),score=11.43 gb/GECG01000827.1/:1-717(+)